MTMSNAVQPFQSMSQAASTMGYPWGWSYPTSNIVQPYQGALQVAPWSSPVNSPPAISVPSPVLQPALESDQALSEPMVQSQPQVLRFRDWFLHPFQSYHLNRLLHHNDSPNESFADRLGMYRLLQKNLSPQGLRYLYQQLNKGALTDTHADDNRSTLYHLASILSTPRADGLDAKIILEESLRLISESQTITQRFGALSEKSIAQLTQYYQSPNGPKLSRDVDVVKSLKEAYSATCVAASVMYYMTERQPSEFVRHIAGLTSQQKCFYEKALPEEIAPENPAMASQKLSEYGVPASVVQTPEGGQYYWIKVNLPESGLIRAVNQEEAHQNLTKSAFGDPHDTQGVVEAAYQAALIHLADHDYDPGLGMHINPDGTLDYNTGLEAERKTLMESIIKDNGGVMQVNYQFTASGRDGEPYLIGYYRSFDNTLNDLLQALNMHEKVIIGIVDTDLTGNSAGRLDMKHEVTVTGYEHDPKTGEVQFILADSDDRNPNLVKKSASDLIPMIHHAGFPVKLAMKILSQVNQMPEGQYMLPDAQDAQKYHPIATVPADRQQAFLADYNQMLQEEEMKQQQSAVPQQPNPYGYSTMVQMQPTAAAPNPWAYFAYPGTYMQQPQTNRMPSITYATSSLTTPQTPPALAYQSYLGSYAQSPMVNAYTRMPSSYYPYLQGRYQAAA